MAVWVDFMLSWGLKKEEGDLQGVKKAKPIV